MSGVGSLFLLATLAVQSPGKAKEPFQFLFRVLDDRGRVVPAERLFGEATLSVVIDEFRSGSSGLSFAPRVDAHGREPEPRPDGLIALEHPAEADFLGRESTLEVHVVSVREGEIDRLGPPVLAGRSDFLEGRLVERARFRPGENLLPDLVLQVPPVLVRGVVQDVQGAPLAGATVYLHRAPAPQDPFAPDTIFCEGTYSNAPTDEFGRFELRGLYDDVAFRVTAMHTALGIDPGQVVVRGGSVYLGRTPAGRISGSVLREKTDEAVRLCAFASGEDGREFGALVNPDGSFEIRNVPPGTYRVGAYPTGAGGTEVCIEGVRVESDGSCADLRLAAIDLRGKFHDYDIHVVDASGAGIPGPVLELEVRRGGYEPRQVRLFPGAHTIVLQRAEWWPW